MSKPRFSWPMDQETRRPSLRPFLLLALILSILAFVSTLLAQR
jgi:hypothetical protein